MKQRKRRGWLGTSEGMERWEAAFQEAGKSVDQICRSVDVSNWPPKWKHRWAALVKESDQDSPKAFLPSPIAMRRFRAGKPIEESTLLLVFYAVGISPRRDRDYRPADPILVREAPPVLPGAYVVRAQVENHLTRLIDSKLSESEPEQGLWLSLEGGDGAGKTRLALELLGRYAMRNLKTHFVSFQSLEPQSADAGVSEALSPFMDVLIVSLGGQPGPTHCSALLALLPDEPVLMVLDNLESVPGPEVQGIIAALVQAVPRAIVLSTSQLPTEEDAAVRVDLSSGLEASEAEKLLRMRMAESLPPGRTLGLSEGEVQDIVQACQGIPAAIEDMAALARTPMQPLKVARELKRILEGASDSMDIASHFNRVRWSTTLWGYAHIQKWAGRNADAIQKAYRACGAFAGPFTSEDFEAVAGPGESKWLLDLESAYMLSADPGQGLWSQDPFRRSVSVRLLQEHGEADAIAQRFFDYFFQSVVSEAPRFGRADSDLTGLRRSQPNWVRALYMLGDRIQKGERSASELFYRSRFAILGSAYYFSWNCIPLLKLIEKASEQRGELAAQATAARGIGIVLLCRDDRLEYPRWFHTARDIFWQIGDREGEADCLRCIAEFYFISDKPLAVSLLKQALEIMPAEEPLGQALILRHLSLLQLPSEQGYGNLQKARDIFTALGRFNDIASCDQIRAMRVSMDGEFSEAAQLMRTGLVMARAGSDIRQEIEILKTCVWWHFMWAPEDAERHFPTDQVGQDIEALQRLTKEYGHPLWTGDAALQSAVFRLKFENDPSQRRLISEEARQLLKKSSLSPAEPFYGSVVALIDRFESNGSEAAEVDTIRNPQI